ncbi:ACT domain-containing protein [Peribacillus frigoritolerans]|uniref:ACT domain-containing protein n=1 Tax=Peribacillus frigoritolerans TaxID=450367 RepID=UPI003D33266A
MEVQEFDEYPFKFLGERPTLVIRYSDQKGVIAELSDILYQKGINIARMANERSKINGAAITVCEIDNIIEDTLLSLLKREIPVIEEIVLVQTK